MPIDLNQFKLNTQEQEQKLREINLSQFRLKKPIDLAEQQRIQQQGEEATEFLKKPWYKQMFTKQVAKELPSGIAQTAIGTPAKFIASAAEVPKTLLTGKAAQKEYKLPFLPKFKSYISKAETTAGKIVEGKKPLSSVLIPFATVPLAGLETAVMAKGAYKTVKGAYNLLNQWKTDKTFKQVVEAVSPAMTKKEAVKTIEQGRAKITGLFKKGVEKVPNIQDLRIAETVKPFYNKNPIKFANNIKNGIKETAEKVGSFLNKNKVGYSPEKLINKIDTIQPPKLITPENATAVQGAKDIAKDIITLTEPNNASLWKARIVFDNEIEAAKKGTLDPSRISSINLTVRQIRRTMNAYIAEITKGGIEFTNQMKRMTDMYDAVENIAEKNYQLLQAGKNIPLFKGLLKEGLKYGGAAIAGGLVGREVFKERGIGYK